MNCVNLFNSFPKLTDKEIELKRREIYFQIISKKELTLLMSVKKMIELYDRLFFDGLLKKQEISIKFGDKTRITKTVSASSNPRYTLQLSLKTANNMVKSLDDKIFGNVVSCYDLISALQLLVEHELIHLLVDHIYCESDEYRDYHTELFKKAIGMIFSHKRTAE